MACLDCATYNRSTWMLLWTSGAAVGLPPTTHTRLPAKPSDTSKSSRNWALAPVRMSTEQRVPTIANWTFLKPTGVDGCLSTSTIPTLFAILDFCHLIFASLFLLLHTLDRSSSTSFSQRSLSLHSPASASRSKARLARVHLGRFAQPTPLQPSSPALDSFANRISSRIFTSSRHIFANKVKIPILKVLHRLLLFAEPNIRGPLHRRPVPHQLNIQPFVSASLKTLVALTDIN